MKKKYLKTAAAAAALYAVLKYAGKKRSPESFGNGKTVLITGASGGLGRAFAEEFGKHGFDLVLVSRSREKLEKAASELETQYGVDCTVIDEDLSVPGGAERVYSRVKEQNIYIDQLVNNAGAGKMNRVVDADISSMTDLINLNCTAVAVLCRLFGADMVKRGSGRILNVASLGALMPDPYFNVYGPGKAFDYYLSLAMYGELRHTGVTVTTLCVGPVKTNWTKNAGKADSLLAKEPQAVAREGFAAMQGSGSPW